MRFGLSLRLDTLKRLMSQSEQYTHCMDHIIDILQDEINSVIYNDGNLHEVQELLTILQKHKNKLLDREVE